MPGDLCATCEGDIWRRNNPPPKRQRYHRSTRLVMPPTWKQYKWPRWVPKDVRRQVREFWSEKFGRSPGAWHKGTVGDHYNGHPAMGEKVTAKLACEKGRHFTGRWVPMWNNIGRLIARGRVEVVSTIGITKRHNHD
ncbi:MAG TPA: hypothetical protein VMQ76_03150 [Terracidiphilus sp.]|nr:hypothetical protein [Terracidiphilus sp.]